MSAGLFGKLPAKRDFIEHGMPPGFMALWDPWLQGAVASSRHLLGAGWLDVYLSAPIWRFWLAPGIAGTATLGAIMPSVDGVGRYFPLSLVVQGDVASPEYDGHDAWFAAGETLLLAALDDGTLYDDLLAALPGLPAPAPLRGAPRHFATLRGGSESRSFWWVPDQAAFVRPGMPNPSEYAMMIGNTGELDPGLGG